MRGVVNALVLMLGIYALTWWLVCVPHTRCDPLNALPWLNCRELGGRGYAATHAAARPGALAAEPHALVAPTRAAAR